MLLPWQRGTALRTSVSPPPPRAGQTAENQKQLNTKTETSAAYLRKEHLKNGVFVALIHKKHL